MSYLEVSGLLTYKVKGQYECFGKIDNIIL